LGIAPLIREIREIRVISGRFFVHLIINLQLIYSA